MKIGITSLECKVVKNAKQGTELLFIGVENLTNLICCLCQIRWSKPPRAFGNFVEGGVVDKFGIQTLVQFSFEFWSNFVLNRATLNCFWVGRAARTTSRQGIVGVLDRQTYEGGTRGSRLCG
jgi:hypothetical protein